MASGVETDARAAARVMERCELLGQISEEDGVLFSPYGSEAMRRVNRLVGYWMRAVGMTVRALRP